MIKSNSSLDQFGRPLPNTQNGYYLPSVTTDALVFRNRPDGYQDVLLITRKKDPFKGQLAFPGGFVDYNEDPRDACLRELEEECSVRGKETSLITVEGSPLRDPRGHTITIAYQVKIPDDSIVKPADDAAEAKFYSVKEIMLNQYVLAFDHFSILKKALIQLGVIDKYS